MGKSSYEAPTPSREETTDATVATPDSTPETPDAVETPAPTETTVNVIVNPPLPPSKDEVDMVEDAPTFNDDDSVTT